MPIGSLLDFKILVRTETMGEGKYWYNRFFVEGACKYSYNNGSLAKDPILAATNFIKALDKINGLIPKFKEEITDLKRDLAVMQEIVDTPWRKADELSRLRVELAALERKIQNDLREVDEQEEKKEEVAVVAESVTIAC